MKSNIYKIISGLLLPIAFIALFFIIGGTEHGKTCWIAFASVVISYAMLIAVPLFIPNSQSTYLFGVTSGTVTGVFFAIQFVISMIFMISDFEKWKIALIVEMILFAGVIFLLLQLLQADEITAKKEQKHEQEVYSVKNLVFKAKTIFDAATDIEIKKYAKSVYNELNTCQTSSNSQIKMIDETINLNLDNLSQFAMVGDVEKTKSVASSLITLIKKRKVLSKQGE